MIRGSGTDIVEICRIEALIEKYGAHFLNRVFTSAEIDYCRHKARPAIHFAGRWAAKEAFYKALPSSCQLHSTWKSVEVLPAAHGNHPVMHICSEELRDRLERENVSMYHVSISHERSLCVAIVILE